MWNRPDYGTAPIRALESALRERLPLSWQVALEQERHERRDGPDALLHITSPDGGHATLAVELKRRLDPIDVPRVTEQFRRAGTPERNLVAAPFLSPRTRELLTRAGVSYADATGNVRLVLNRPPVVIELSGAMSDPWKVRRERPVTSLKGAAAGRVVRALCDFRPPFGIRELAARSGTPASSVSRVVALLEREALLRRAPRGPISEVEWPALIRHWTQDYALAKANRVNTFLEPRGLTALLDKLRALEWRYAVTGSLAAADLAPVAAPRLAAIYVEDADLAARRLGLRPAERGANVLLAEPFDPVAFDRARDKNGVTYAAPSQVAADLLTGPGREPAEGEELIRWMEQHEDDWRA